MAAREASDVATDIFALDLGKVAANHQALTPLDFLDWAESVFAGRTGVIDGARRFTWGETASRVRSLADALARCGVGKGDTVSLMAPNVPAMLEAHFAVPMCGAVLNALNYRLDAEAIAFILGHAETKVLITGTEFAPVIGKALRLLGRAITVIDIVAPGTAGERLGETDYESFLKTGDPERRFPPPDDEWQALSLCYTSGTTGNPKGVVYHHRGAFLNALSGALTMRMQSDSVLLWTLPMFHCNGWTYTWGATAVGATHVCLRKVEPGAIFQAIAEHGVTHLCGAPIVLNMLIHSPPEVRRALPHRVEVLTGGAAPPSAVIEAMEAMGFAVTHAYGLTEVYGPATWCVPQAEWSALPQAERAARMARQGQRYVTMHQMQVADPETHRPVPADGTTLGEVMFRGNTVMKGYLKNPSATREAFRHGWYHTGDLAVLHPDGYIEVKDRSKDIIISGGENISSLEVEEVLYRHPDIMEAAVVAKPDPHWGEVPCAFVTLKPGAVEPAAEAVIAWCRERLAGFKVPKRIVWGPLPKTSTGKVQKYELRERAKTLP